MNRKSILKLLVSMLLLSMLGIQPVTPVRTTMTQSAAIDLYTQKEDPHSGKGPNQPSGPFKPHEEVILYAYVTNNSNAVPNKIVAFEIHGPPNSIYNITIIRTASTNASGVATTNFRIPWISENPEISIGIWSAYASVQIAEEKVEDTLTFRVGLIVDDDGSADFHTIQEAINNATDGDTIFVKAGTYYEHVVVNKSVTLIGENRSTTTIDGNGTGNLVLLEGADNITVTGFTVRNASIAFYILGFNHTIIRNIISNNAYHGIDLVGRNNHISENTITNNRYGIIFGASSYNIISRNTIMSNQGGINLGEDCENNDITKNTLMSNTIGIGIAGNNNRVFENIIKENWSGIEIAGTSNTIYHNDVINNTRQVSILEPSDNSWDDGYPSGGNYWSDYTGVDLYSGPYQNETGSDSIGDTPYVIDADNRDKYPLTNPYSDIGIINITLSKTVVGQGYSLSISVKISNYGIDTENFNVTAYANTTTIAALTNVTLLGGNSATITFTWNTTGWAKGNYAISAYAWPVPGETDTRDNTCTGGTVRVNMVGDVKEEFGIVDIYDFVYVAGAFGAKHTPNGMYYHAPPDGPCPYCPHDPNADLNSDGMVDIFDVVIVAAHFGEKDP